MNLLHLFAQRLKTYLQIHVRYENVIIEVFLYFQLSLTFVFRVLMLEMIVPNGYCGRVIGKGGKKINQITVSTIIGDVKYYMVMLLHDHICYMKSIQFNYSSLHLELSNGSGIFNFSMESSGSFQQFLQSFLGRAQIIFLNFC